MTNRTTSTVRRSAVPTRPLTPFLLLLIACLLFVALDIYDEASDEISGRSFPPSDATYSTPPHVSCRVTVVMARVWN